MVSSRVGSREVWRWLDNASGAPAATPTRERRRCAKTCRRSPGLPPAQGLYDPAHEHDACGVGFVADIKGRKSHDDRRARPSRSCQPRAPRRLRLRGQHRRRRRHPHPDARTRSSRRECAALGIAPARPAASTASAWSSCRATPTRPAHVRGASSSTIVARGGPARPRLARRADRQLAARRRPRASVEPVMRQVFIGRGAAASPTDAAFERKLYVIRKRVENAVRRSRRSRERKYVLRPEPVVPTRSSTRACSPPTSSTLSSRTCTTRAWSRRWRWSTQRFSTNTFPSWPLRAPVPLHRPQRRDQHAARQHQLDARPRGAVRSPTLFGDDLEKILPIIDEGGSDSAMFDNALELLVLAGRSLPHAMMMMIPEAWSGHESMSPEKQGVLRVPRLPDGAVGRPGVDRLHRRHA